MNLPALKSTTAFSTLALCGLLAASHANAALVPVNFTVSPSANQSVQQFLGTSFQQAVHSAFGAYVTQVTGQFNYDPTTVGLTSASPIGSSGTYAMGSPFSIGFYSGVNLLFSELANPHASSNIQVLASSIPSFVPSYVTVNVNSGTFDSSLFATSSVNYSLQAVQLTLTDPGQSVITSNALPSNATWQGLPATLSITTVSSANMSPLVSTASVQAGSLVVPEPAPLALLATGLLVLGVAVRRKHDS